MAAKKFIKSAIVTSLAILTLSGCEEVASDLFGFDKVESDPGSLQSIEGKTADGYLVNAKVCMDLNDNSVCDADEPTTTSGDGGTYSFDSIPNDIDLSTVRIVVEIIANQTIDEDNPGEVLTQAYTLTSPPGQPAFVSPITTIIDAVMQNDDELTPEEAEAQVKESLGISDDSDVSLFDDYVEASENGEESAEVYQQIHLVAQVVADVIATSVEDINNQDTSLTDDEAFAETLNAVVSNIEDSLDEIAEVVEDIVENAEDGADLSELIEDSAEMEFVTEEAELDAEEVVEKVEELEEEKSAESTDVETLLTEQEGFFFLNSDDDRYWTGEECKVDYEFSYDQFKIRDNLGIMNEWYYNMETAMFEQEQLDHEDDDNFSFYTLATDGWMLSEEGTPQVDNFSDDGQTLTVSFPGQGSRTIVAKQIDLSGKDLKDIERIDEAWSYQMMASNVFPTDSTMFVLEMTQLTDVYMVPVFECYDATGMEMEDNNCNKIWKVQIPMDMEEPEENTGEGDGTGEEKTEDEEYDDQYTDYIAKTLDELINTEWDGEISSLVTFHAPMSRYMEVALIEETVDSATNRYALFFERDWNCYPGMVNEDGTPVDCMHIIEIGQTPWDTTEMNGQTLLMMELLEFEEEDEFDGVFLTEVEGYVRTGLYMQEGRVWRDEHALNETALDAAVLGFEMPEGPMVVAKEECGVFDDHKDDDGMEGDDDENQGPAPVITSDATNTEMLTNTVYVLEEMDEETGESETVVVQFGEQGILKVLGVETEMETDENTGETYEYKDEFVELGTWVIDADKQLLLTLVEFEEDENGDVVAKSDWILLKIDGDIGETFTAIETTDEGEETLNFSELTATEMTSSLMIMRGEGEEACELTLSFDETVDGNTGMVDTSACPDMSEEGDMSFTWDTGSFGQLILNIDSNDEMVTNNTVEIFQNAEGMIYLIIEGDEEEMHSDGTSEIYHFVSIEKWKVVVEN